MRLLIFITLFSWVAPYALANSEPNLWATEGDWEILSRSGEGPECFARRIYEGETEVQIGTVPSPAGWYFAAYNSNWTHLNEGTVRQVEFEFSDVIFAGHAEFRMQAGSPGGYAFFNNPEFLDEFGKRMSVTVSGPNGTGIDIDLSGSKRAVAAVENCQSAQLSSNGNPSGK